jgi:hypothetical protein
LIVERLYVAEDAAFYDLDAQNRFVKVRSIALARVCGEHVVDATMFAAMWERQLGNPQAFWAAFLLPSIALNDAAFVRPIARNSWGGPSQALTALRAGRWMEFYGKAAEFAQMMRSWCEALARDRSFRQQMDPLTGEFTKGGSPSYSPAALVMYDYTWRLAGVREEGGEVHWNVRPGLAVSESARFAVEIGRDSAEMRYDDGGAELMLGGRRLGRVDGTARLVTDREGGPRALVGIDTSAQKVTLRLHGEPHRRFKLAANQQMPLDR